MSDDPFAFQVERLTRRHRDRHDAATVAQVTLQGWLTMRHRFDDPFDPQLFDHVDARLAAMPTSGGVDNSAAHPARPGRVGHQWPAGQSADRGISLSA